MLPLCAIHARIAAVSLPFVHARTVPEEATDRFQHRMAKKLLVLARILPHHSSPERRSGGTGGIPNNWNTVCSSGVGTARPLRVTSGPSTLPPLPALQHRRAEGGASRAQQERRAPVVRLRQKQIELQACVPGQGELIVAASGVAPLGDAVGVASVQVLPEELGRAVA